MIHPQSCVDPTAVLPDDILVWQFVSILANVTAGQRCSVGAGAEIGRGTTLGDDVRISHGVFLPANSRIGYRVFIGPNTTFTDDRYPRVGNTDYTAEPPVIEDDVAIGAGVTVLPGVHIGHHALIAAGAVVTKSVEPWMLVIGPQAITVVPMYSKAMRQELLQSQAVAGAS